MRIGLSYHNGDSDYDAYETALLRRAEALGMRVEAVWLAGRDRPALTALLRGLDALCFAGGADVDPARYGRADAELLCRVDPVRDATEWALLEYAARRSMPLLGICRGAQLLNVFFGGTLVPDLGEANAAHRSPPIKSHPVRLEAGSMLERIAGGPAGTTNSSHHQAVERVAAGFRATAWAPDGTIEAFEPISADRFVLGVQWHPELMMAGEALADGVLDALLAATTAAV